MIVRIQEILEEAQKTSVKTGRPYTVTTFKGEDGKLYKDIFGKFTVGQDVIGDWKEGQYGLKFEVEKPAFTGGGGAKSYGKTPEQIKEERTSIERQVCLKAAVELAVGQMPITGKAVTSTQLLKVADLFVSWLTDHKSLPVITKEVETPQEQELDDLDQVMSDAGI